MKSDRYNIYEATDSAYEEFANMPGYLVYDTSAVADLVGQDGAALVFASKSDAEEHIAALELC